MTVRLEGTASNRDGVGAQVTVDSGGRRQVSQRFGGGSYQSAGAPRLHFGLGGSTRVDALEVRWPSGRVDRYAGLAADMGYHLREGDPEAKPLKGWEGPGDGNGADVPVKGLRIGDVVPLVRGPKGTTVRLTIVSAKKDGSQPSR